MTGRRLIALCVVAFLLIGGGVLVSLSEGRYRVDFTSLVEMWGDVLRDADRVGLTVTRVSDRTEIELGAELAKRLDHLIISDSKLQKYISEVGQRLVKQVRRKGIEYRFQVIDRPSINAFALPGGNIYVTTGMLSFAKSEAEIAAIIAHEISHVDLRHCIERFQYELLARRLLPSDLAAISTLPYSFLLVAYSEQQEREADVDAVIIAAKAGYHPKYGLTLYDRMGALGDEARRATPPIYLIQEFGAAVWEALKEYFQTHPSWPDRIREITGVLRRNESDWKARRFYVGRSNYAGRTSWTPQPVETELRPYAEPPAYGDYVLAERYPHFKAIATHVLSGLSGVASNELTPSAAISRAMSECEKKVKPCQLYAVGDTVVLDRPQHEIDSVVSDYSISGRIARAFKSYLSGSDFKALAVDSTSGWSGTGVGLATLARAIEEAMAHCSEQERTCELYAVGDTVVHGLPKEQADAAMEQYRQRVVAGRIAKLQQAYLDNPTYRDFKALSIDYQSGQFAVSQAQATPSQAIERAIEACSTQTVACQVHAISDTVVQGKSKDERDVIASNYGREVIERISGGRFKEYLSRRDFKTFAIDVPRNFWAYESGHWHPLGSFNSVLKRCRERGIECEVAALGDTLVLGAPASELDALIHEYYERVVWPTDVRNPLREYLNEERFTDFKAFAAEPRKRNWQREWGYQSPYKAIEETVAKCRTRNPACELYAIGNHIVYRKSDDEQNATIAAYAREVLEKRLEFFRQPPYTDFKAVAGNANTMQYRIAYGRASAEDAVQEAMRSCAEQYAPCQLFAVGETIVFGLPQDRVDQIIEQYQRVVNASRNVPY